MAKSIYDQLKDEIISDRWGDGYSLAETALGERFGCSRTPVREALLRLEQDSLVERGERGWQVKGRTANDILEIYDVRLVLEGLAARRAAEVRNDLDVAKLEAWHAKLTEIDPSDGVAVMEGHRGFHEILWQSSHNKTLCDILRRLQMNLNRFPATNPFRANRWPAVLVEHQELIEAIVERDPDRADKSATEHMVAVRKARFELYANPDYTGAESR